MTDGQLPFSFDGEPAATTVPPANPETPEAPSGPPPGLATVSMIVASSIVPRRRINPA